MAAPERNTGVLVRVGADTTCGGANAPIRVATGEYVYVPIPERAEHVRNGYGREYAEVAHRVRAFVGSDDVDRWLPRDERFTWMHLVVARRPGAPVAPVAPVATAAGTDAPPAVR